MSPSPTYALAGVLLLGLGLGGLFLCADLLRKVLAVNIAGSGVFILLVALAPPTADGAPDPIPRALVLTGIVVAVSATAVALGLLRRLSRAAEHGPTEGPPG